jgi:hypothetical protein
MNPPAFVATVGFTVVVRWGDGGTTTVSGGSIQAAGHPGGRALFAG